MDGVIAMPRKPLLIKHSSGEQEEEEEEERPLVPLQLVPLLPLAPKAKKPKVTPDQMRAAAMAGNTAYAICTVCNTPYSTSNKFNRHDVECMKKVKPPLKRPRNDPPGAGAGAQAKRAKKGKKVAAPAAAAAAEITIQKDIDFLRPQVMRHEAHTAFTKKWQDLLEPAINYLCQTGKFASNFRNVLEATWLQGHIGGVILPPIPDDFFSVKSFDHTFKAVMLNVRVHFHPVIQLVRCIWLQDILVQLGHVDRANMITPAQLWPEIVAHDLVQKEKEKLADEKKKALEKKKKDQASGNVVQEEAEQKEEQEEQQEEEDSDNENSDEEEEEKEEQVSLVSQITRHPSLANILPPCERLGQCVKYASKSYRTNCQQYQVTGFRAHFGWYLVNTYRISKRDARSWLETNLNLIPVAEDEKAAAAVADDNAEARAQLLEKIANEELGEEEEEDQEQEENGANDLLDPRAEWNERNQAREANRLVPLSNGKRNSFLRIIVLHRAILLQLEASNLLRAQQQLPLRWQSKLFALAPLANFGRRFMRFDVEALNRIGQLTGANKLKSLDSVFISKAIRTKNHLKKNQKLSSTFMTDGVQVHVMWEKIITLSCQVNAAKQAKFAATHKEKMDKIEKAIANGEKVDKRTTREQKPSFLATSNEILYRKTTANFEDYTCGIFQSSSIRVTRDAFIKKLEAGLDGGAPAPAAPNNGRSPLHDLKLLPYRIKSIDPGRTNVICSAEWDYNTSDWKVGFNLTNRRYYDKIGSAQRQKRLQGRLVRMKDDNLQPHHNDPAPLVATHIANLSRYSPKTASVDVCRIALNLVTMAWDDMFSFYGSRNVTYGRLRTAQKKQRLVADMIEKLAPESEKHNTIIVLGSARFATATKGAQSSPIGYLMKELSKVRRVVLVDEYFTTQMCSGCNLSGVGSASSTRAEHLVTKADSEKDDPGISKYPLSATSRLKRHFTSVLGKTGKIKSNHLAHPTAPMASFKRTLEPQHERFLRQKRLASRAAAAVAAVAAQHPLAAPPYLPLPLPPPVVVHTSCSRVIHGLKQCTRKCTITILLSLLSMYECARLTLFFCFCFFSSSFRLRQLLVT